VSVPSSRWCLLALVAASACIDLTEPRVRDLTVDGAARDGAGGALPTDGPLDRGRLDGTGPTDGAPPIADGAPEAPPIADGAPEAPPQPASDGPPASSLDGGPTMDAPLMADAGAIADAPVADASPIPDVAAGALVVDDFSDGDLTTNNLGGAVTADNETLTVAAGEQKVVWTGTGTVQSFDEGLRANHCELDISGFRTVRFRVRSSVAGRRLAVLLGVGDGACNQDGVIRQTTITITTTMTSYDVDLTHTTRDKTLFLQLAPTSVDSAEYVLDDIVLLP
jgi:hypothetical protein